MKKRESNERLHCKNIYKSSSWKTICQIHGSRMVGKLKLVPFSLRYSSSIENTTAEHTLTNPCLQQSCLLWARAIYSAINAQLISERKRWLRRKQTRRQIQQGAGCFLFVWMFKVTPQTPRINPYPQSDNTKINVCVNGLWDDFLHCGNFQLRAASSAKCQRTWKTKRRQLKEARGC